MSHQPKMPGLPPHITGLHQAIAYESWVEEGRCDRGMLAPYLMKVDQMIGGHNWHRLALHCCPHTNLALRCNLYDIKVCVLLSTDSCLNYDEKGGWIIPNTPCMISRCLSQVKLGSRQQCQNLRGTQKV